MQLQRGIFTARLVRQVRRFLSRPLHRTLPCAVPSSVHIDPCNACNFRCTFCPTGDPQLLRSVQRPVARLSMALFVKALDGLQSMAGTGGGKIETIHLYQDGEPLLNDQLYAMIAGATARRIARAVSTTTNGSLLDSNAAGQLLQSGLDVIRISVEQVGTDEYRRITRTFDNYELIRENVSRLFTMKKRARSPLRIIVKITDSGLTPQQRDRFSADFGPVCDELRIDSLMGWSRSDLKDFTLGHGSGTAMDGFTRRVPKVVCPEPFRSIAVNADGSVSVCCVDWSHGTVVGSLQSQSLPEIWNGEALRALRLKHLHGNRREIPACANCDFLSGFSSVDNLDKHAGRLLRIYSRQ